MDDQGGAGGATAADAARDRQRVAGQVVVITGASAGIGAALAERLAREGALVVLTARRAEELQAVAARCGPGALAVPADATDAAALGAVAEAAVARHGRLDVWVNNVGRGITRAPSAVRDADVLEMIRANVLPALYGAEAALPHFRARGTGQLVNVSSMLGRVPSAPFRAAYSAAKHHLNALTANLRDELRTTHPGIVVTLVSPGVVATDFGANALHGGPDSRTLPEAQPVEEVAAVLAWAIAERREDVYTRPGMRQRVLDHFARVGEDPPPEALAP